MKDFNEREKRDSDNRQKALKNLIFTHDSENTFIFIWKVSRVFSETCSLARWIGSISCRREKQFHNNIFLKQMLSEQRESRAKQSRELSQMNHNISPQSCWVVHRIRSWKATSFYSVIFFIQSVLSVCRQLIWWGFFLIFHLFLCSINCWAEK